MNRIRRGLEELAMVLNTVSHILYCTQLLTSQCQKVLHVKKKMMINEWAWMHVHTH